MGNGTFWCICQTCREPWRNFATRRSSGDTRCCLCAPHDCAQRAVAQALADTYGRVVSHWDFTGRGERCELRFELGAPSVIELPHARAVGLTLPGQAAP